MNTPKRTLRHFMTTKTVTEPLTINEATEQESTASLSRVRYRSEFAKSLDSLPENIPGISVQGWDLKRVRLAVAAFNKSRADGQKFRVVAGEGKVFVARAVPQWTGSQLC